MQEMTSSCAAAVDRLDANTSGLNPSTPPPSPHLRPGFLGRGRTHNQRIVQERLQAAPQLLAGAVAVHDAQFAQVRDHRVVEEEARDPGPPLPPRCSQSTLIFSLSEPSARPQVHVHAHARSRRLRRGSTQHAHVLRLGPHPLCRGRPPPPASRGSGPPCLRTMPTATLRNQSPAAPCAASVRNLQRREHLQAFDNAKCGAPPGLGFHRSRLRCSAPCRRRGRDTFSTSASDFPSAESITLSMSRSGPAQAIVLLVQPFPERLFALGNLPLPLLDRDALLGGRATLAVASLGIERARLRVDAIEVHLRPLLVVAQEPPRCRDDGPAASPGAAPSRLPDCGRCAVHAPVGRGVGLRSNAKPPTVTPSAAVPHVLTTSKCVVAMSPRWRKWFTSAVASAPPSFGSVSYPASSSSTSAGRSSDRSMATRLVMCAETC